MEMRPATAEEIAKAEKSGPVPLLPLALDMNGCATQEEMHSNLEATLKRGYEPFMPLLDKYPGTASLVGAGPSIKDTLPELTGDVLAVNSAIGYLLDNGVVPKWAMLWDAAEIVAKFAVPHPDVTYLVASRCHPAVFERLKDCKVVVWHAAGDHDIALLLERNNIMEPMVVGGSAGITRGLYLLDCLGYRDIHIFGADSSYVNGATHVRGSLVPEKDVMVSIGNDPPLWFRTTPEWCAQVNEYRVIFALFHHNDHSKFTVHGEGMLPTMHSILVAKREHLGAQKFIEEIGQQELQSMQLNNAASGLATPEAPPICTPPQLLEAANVVNACQ